MGKGSFGSRGKDSWLGQGEELPGVISRFHAIQDEPSEVPAGNASPWFRLAVNTHPDFLYCLAAFQERSPQDDPIEVGGADQFFLPLMVNVSILYVRVEQE